MYKGNHPEQSRQTAQALNSGAIHLLRAMRDIDRLAGLTPARLSALSVLVFAGSMPLGKLARTEGVAGPTMTGIVDGLRKLGLAVREAHPSNGRISVVSATEAGTSLITEAMNRRIEAIASAIDKLSPASQAMTNGAAPLLEELAALVRSRQYRAES